LNDLTLYGITEEMQALDSLLEMDQGEITEKYEVLEQQIANTMMHKTDSCVGFIEKEKDYILLAEDKIAALQDFVKSKQNKISRFEDYVKLCLEKTGQKSFEGQMKQIKLRKPAQVLFIDDENKIPPQYTKVETKVTIDKKLLKADIKSGEITIEGVSLVDGKTSVILGLKKGK